jgi:hypothetical protein
MQIGLAGLGRMGSSAPSIGVRILVASAGSNPLAPTMNIRSNQQTGRLPRLSEPRDRIANHET